VDSTVCAALLNQALPSDRIFALHIDNGFMRKDETKKVVKALESLGLRLTVIDATETFLNSSSEIKGVKTKPLHVTTNPEEKRKIIGDTFMRVAEQEIAKLGLQPSEVFLAQGTLRPDLIESASALASSKADAIKTHHNDTELVRELRKQGRVIEPLKDYHKDEVRELGRKLGLAEELVMRQPFPGPGLAIRILCTEKPFIDNSFQETNAQLQAFLQSHNNRTRAVMQKLSEEYGDFSGISATLLPIQSVGVQGDGRSYRYVAALSGEQDWDKLFALAKVIPHIFHNINRVVYVFG
jgi:GMP synthase (glutamine-hydrolysing)